MTDKQKAIAYDKTVSYIKNHASDINSDGYLNWDDLCDKIDEIEQEIKEAIK